MHDEELYHAIESECLHAKVVDWLSANYGSRCPEHDDDCTLCRRWAAVDHLFGEFSGIEHYNEAERTPQWSATTRPSYMARPQSSLEFSAAPLTPLLVG
jgi:hypothetical protein